MHFMRLNRSFNSEMPNLQWQGRSSQSHQRDHCVLLLLR